MSLAAHLCVWSFTPVLCQQRVLNGLQLVRQPRAETLAANVLLRVLEELAIGVEARAHGPVSVFFRCRPV